MKKKTFDNFISFTCEFNGNSSFIFAGILSVCPSPIPAATPAFVLSYKYKNIHTYMGKQWLHICQFEYLHIIIWIFTNSQEGVYIRFFTETFKYISTWITCEFVLSDTYKNILICINNIPCRRVRPLPLTVKKNMMFWLWH